MSSFAMVGGTCLDLWKAEGQDWHCTVEEQKAEPHQKVPALCRAEKPVSFPLVFSFYVSVSVLEHVGPHKPLHTY